MQFLIDLFTLQNFLTLLMLVMLQAVLGFDNLLYISIESKRVEPDKQALVRLWGIGLAIILRLLLLITLMSSRQLLESPLFGLHLNGVFDAEVHLYALIVLAGGVFIIYTAVKEIYHMLAMHDLGESAADKPKRSVVLSIVWIVVMNVVFSFDSILSAMALTNNFMVMAAAVVISGAMMIWLSDRVAQFLEKNRMYEVLGLFVLLIVGVMLLAEGGHLAELAFFGYHIEQMASSTFYFVIAVLVIVDIVQGRYQKKLLAEKATTH
ncbi:MAG: hypothetical protein KDB22_07555 [Planctomycetales bacterium]|nr:hypothetical protein [Planctomycetales bacterium]